MYTVWIMDPWCCEVPYLNCNWIEQNLTPSLPIKAMKLGKMKYAFAGSQTWQIDSHLRLTSFKVGLSQYWIGRSLVRELWHKTLCPLSKPFPATYRGEALGRLSGCEDDFGLTTYRKVFLTWMFSSKYFACLWKPITLLLKMLKKPFTSCPVSYSMP